MKTTSMDGSTLTARSMSTASVIEAARHMNGWNCSTAHSMTAWAGACSKPRLRAASSSRLNSGAWRWVPVLSSVVMVKDGDRGPLTRRALAFADLGLVRAGLVEVDVVLGVFVRFGP